MVLDSEFPTDPPQGSGSEDKRLGYGRQAGKIQKPLDAEPGQMGEDKG